MGVAALTIFRTVFVKDFVIEIWIILGLSEGIILAYQFS